jgi:hypothetical protein
MRLNTAKKHSPFGLSPHYADRLPGVIHPCIDHIEENNRRSASDTVMALLKAYQADMQHFLRDGFSACERGTRSLCKLNGFR